MTIFLCTAAFIAGMWFGAALATNHYEREIKRVYGQKREAKGRWRNANLVRWPDDATGTEWKLTE